MVKIRRVCGVKIGAPFTKSQEFGSLGESEGRLSVLEFSFALAAMRYFGVEGFLHPGALGAYFV